MQIRTAGELRGFLADIMIGIREGEVDCAQAHAISKVAAQINQSLATEINTALQLERMGQDRPVAGSLLIRGADETPAFPEEDQDARWVRIAVQWVGRFRRAEDIIEFGAGHSDRLERLMNERPDLHAQITAAIDLASTRVRPAKPMEPSRLESDEQPPDELWCEECEMPVSALEAAGCKSRNCSLKAVA